MKLYTSLMRLLIVILLVNALVALPLSGYVFSDPGCCGSGETGQSVGIDEMQSMDLCCSMSVDKQMINPAHQRPVMMGIAR